MVPIILIRSYQVISPIFFKYLIYYFRHLISLVSSVCTAGLEAKNRWFDKLYVSFNLVMTKSLFDAFSLF